jgi:hypothetical protein
MEIKSTNINKTNNYFSFQMIEKKRPQHMSIEIQFLAWDWHKNVSGSKLKNGITTQGRIQDFKLGEAQLKKLRRAEGGAKIFEVFRVNFTLKKYIFSNFRGGGGAGCAPLWIRPCTCIVF